MKFLLLLWFIQPFIAFSQIEGTVVEQSSSEPVFGAKVVASSGEKAISDADGKFTMNVTSFPVTLIISAQAYRNDTITVSSAGPLILSMYAEVQQIKTVVVTAGRRDQDIEYVPISMEIIRPDLFDHKGLTTIEEAVDLSPGVYTMDGQVSIRGGSGFAYGAGSRVLLLWNGIPVLSGDAGDAKWNAIPMECASQIELLKGASSVLYGSGALNGIISLSEREPTLDGETRVKIQGTVFGTPKRAGLKWWTTPPTAYTGDVYHGKMKKNWGYTISANGYHSTGYKEGETESRGRVSGTIYIRPQKFKTLKAGIGYNYQYQKTGNFIIWESDSLAYTPFGTADTSNSQSTLTYNTGARFRIDPYVKFFDKKKNLHMFKSRYYLVTNNNVTNQSQSSNSAVSFADYQFQHKWGKGTVLTSGMTYSRTDVYSNLFGDHFSNNYAAYAQYEQRISRLDVTGGIRLEYFDQDNQRGDSDFYLGRDSAVMIPVYPIVRLGAHYQLAKHTHLRASFGQGIRYPSVAERYTKTAVGALLVFPNPNLTPETGWAAEFGIKQAIRMGESWKGLIDLAGFVNEYNNMMEFQFGIFNPITNERLDPSSPDYNQTIADIFAADYAINDLFGFGAVNAEQARISGVELSFSSQGEIKGVELTSLMGYTYMNPLSLNADSAYRATFSDTTTNVLKYRFRHLVKFDLEAAWKGFSLGATVRYNSFMSNIDAIFENEISTGVFILPGLKEYREHRNRGLAVLDIRCGYEFFENYRAGFMVNNILNTEYTSRPGDVQPPRNFTLQLQMKL